MTSTPAVTAQTEFAPTGSCPSLWVWFCAARADDPNNVRQRQPRLVDLAERAIAEGTPWLRPQNAFSILILSNGTELRGFGIARKLTCAASVIAGVATLGSEL
jgi:hypothetical protein